MAEYIEREAALHEIERREALMAGDKCISVDAMKSFVKNRPAVDVAPVVRCKDCKHLRVWNQKDLYAFCQKTNIVFLPFELDTRTHFCSYGARIGGGADNASN